MEENAIDTTDIKDVHSEQEKILLSGNVHDYDSSSIKRVASTIVASLTRRIQLKRPFANCLCLSVKKSLRAKTLLRKCVSSISSFSSKSNLFLHDDSEIVYYLYQRQLDEWFSALT